LKRSPLRKYSGFLVQRSVAKMKGHGVRNAVSSRPLHDITSADQLIVGILYQ